MKAKNLVDLGIVELDAEDYALTPEEQARENERIVNQIKAEGEKIEEVDDTRLNISITEGTEERQDAALSILEKEKMLQAERIEEWQKEKKRKKRKRVFKSTILIVIAIIIALAWVSGYRIEIPQEVVVHIEGIFNSAKDFVVNFFTNN